MMRGVNLAGIQSTWATLRPNKSKHMILRLIRHDGRYKQGRQHPWVVERWPLSLGE